MEAVALEEQRAADWQRSVYVVTGSQFLVFVTFNFIIPFLPLFIQQLGVHDPGQVRVYAGVQQAASSLGMIVMGPVWGWLADRYGRKPLLMRALGCAAIFAVITGLVQNYWQLLLVRFLMGATTGTQGAAMALVSTLSPRSRIAYAVGMVQMANYTGLFVGPLLGGILADSIGVRSSCVVAAAIAGVAFLSVGSLVREDFERPAPIASAKRISPWRNMGQLVAGEQLLPLLSVILAVSIAIYALPPIIPLFVQTLPNVTVVATITGIALGAAGICSAITSPLIGRYAPRLGYLRVLVFCAAGAGLTSASLSLVRGVPGLVLAEAGLGLFTGGLLPVAYTLVSLGAPSQRQGMLYGISTAVYSMGVGLGPVAAGFLAASAGIRPVFLASGAILLGVPILIALAVRERSYG